MKKISAKHRNIIIVLSALAVIGIIIIFLFYYGILWFNMPSEKEYPVRGVDVSHYQNEIDWDVLASQNIDFAFIKATEGSSHKDTKFQVNFENARKTHLYIGAYHFFSFDSSGITQAENFIDSVPIYENALPPVIDLEYYSDKASNPPTKEHTREILDDMIKALKTYYGVTPIIYTTKSCYERYLADGYYSDIPIWIRDITSTPQLDDGKEWTFWQYSNRKRLKGYVADEYFIDMNVFNGTKEEFMQEFNLT